MHAVKGGWKRQCLECVEKARQVQPNLKFPVEPEPEQLKLFRR